jgi:solute carrier family 25 phosphate transporter 3
LGKLSPTKAALKIVESEGPKALTAGLGPTVIGYGLEGALKFGVYESLKPICLLLIPGANSGEAYLAAAVCAGALASIVLCPMEETRIRLVTDPSFGKGLLDGLPKLIEEEGALAPFARGLPPMLSKQVPYTMGKQVSFDIFAAMLYSFLVGLSFVPQKEIALEVEIGAAFLASIVACLSSHPGDVLLTATYKDTSGSDKSDFISTIRKVYNDGGLSAFFRGLNARFVHVGCIITFQLVIYDQIKQGLGLPASGS